MGSDVGTVPVWPPSHKLPKVIPFNGHFCIVREDGMVTVQLNGPHLHKWTNLQPKYDHTQPAQQWTAGQWYLVEWHQDGDVLLERAKLLQVPDTSDLGVLLDFADNGYRGRISKSRIFEFQNYNDVAQIPPLAVAMFVRGVSDQLGSHTRDEFREFEQKWAGQRVFGCEMEADAGGEAAPSDVFTPPLYHNVTLCSIRGEVLALSPTPDEHD